jgi:signal recognition particle receptor subunit beta
MESKPKDNLQAFLEALQARQITIVGEEHEDASLVYANAVLRYHQIITDNPDLIPQIVVIGPTQAGKSTVVNLLLGKEAATSNALAGFTRHAQGFCTHAVTDTLTETIDRLLPGLSRVSLDQLSADTLHSYSITTIAETDAVASPAIFWDTPDFDSVSSRSYRFGVPKLCAIADLVVLVVSKEKYADQSVWETLRLISQIPHPLLICINKSSPDSADQIRAAMASKLRQEGIEADNIVTLPYENHPEIGSMIASPSGAMLRKLATEFIPETHPLPDSAALKQFLQSHWLDWTAPIRREISARRSWEAILDEEVTQAGSAYQSHYLRDPHYSDTIQRAIVKLMELLELPGFARSLGKVRNAISWPARTLMGKLFKQEHRSEQGQKQDHESDTLEEILAEMLVSLQRQIGEHSASDDERLRHWWQQLWMLLQQQSEPLGQLIAERIAIHQREFEPRIEAAAEELFHYLEQHPATLNSLRAARVTTDAAAVVLALKTGGIGLNDLILAPAMLSFTSMLTEGAVGRYMVKVEEELKAAQLESVQTLVFQPIREALAKLPDQLDSNDIYGFAEDTLYAAEQQLNQL